MHNIGVLALQGSVIEHINCIEVAGAHAIPIKKTSQLDEIDSLIIPGGESTTIGILLKVFGLLDPIKNRILDGMPVWGTCAGMILLAKTIVGQCNSHLGVMDITVRRNGFGGQRESFSTNSFIKAISSDSMPLVFIRAPYIESVGNNVDVLSEVDGKIVAARQGNMLATAFHPELTSNTGFYKYFINEL